MRTKMTNTNDKKGPKMTKKKQRKTIRVLDLFV